MKIQAFLLAALVGSTVLAEPRPMDAPLIYAATAPQCASFSPLFGPAGSEITVRGSNLKGVSNVAINGVNVAFTAKTQQALVATAPHAKQARLNIVVTSPAGTATCTALFNLKVTVPMFTGGKLGAALTAIAADDSDLLLGIISGPDDARAKVTGQNPPAGRTVNAGTKVDLETLCNPRLCGQEDFGIERDH